MRVETSTSKCAPLAILCVLIGSVVGCTPKRVALHSSAGTEMQSIHVVNSVAECDPQMRHESAGYMPPVRPLALGLVGGVLQAIGEIQQSRAAKALLARLNDPANPLDFCNLCATQMDSMLAGASWPERRTFETRVVKGSSIVRQKILAESGSDGLLLINSSFYFGIGARYLVVKSMAALYTGECLAPSYRTQFQYASDPVDAPTADSTMSVWAQNGAAMFRGSVRAGLHEIVQMISKDFFEIGGAPTVSAGQEEFEYEDPDSPADQTKWTGVTLAKAGGRLLVRRDNGHLYSLPVGFRKPVTAFKHGEYRFYVSHREEDRMNVYAHHPSGEAKIWIEPKIELAKNGGLTDYKIREMLKRAREHEAEIRATWQRIHGDRLQTR